MDLIDKDCTRLAIDVYLENALADAHDLVIELFLLGILAIVLALLVTVLMGNYRTVVVEDKAISFAVDLNSLDCFLNAGKCQVQTQYVIVIGERLAY